MRFINIIYLTSINESLQNQTKVIHDVNHEYTFTSISIQTISIR